MKCGIRAPSARNNQPWRFTVIKDEVTMGEIIRNVVPGNVLVIVSGLESKNVDKSVDAVSAASSRKVQEELVN